MVLASLLSFPLMAVDWPPISLHPDNPKYLLFRGEPTVLITSGEHYGAVLNRDFDYVRYLEALARSGMDLTRTFSGAYCEHPGAFNIARNTLAPAEGSLLCPWARSDEPGYANGGAKFDLTRYDEAYFERLRDFMREAGKRGIVVEFVLFCPFYGDEQWDLSPMNVANNVNGIGGIPREEVYTLLHEDLLRVQQAMVRRIVAELAPFDNLYYEICNEPYFGGVTLEWQHRIAETIADAEKALPARHLIARNVANGREKVGNLHPAVSILNFHYAHPPDTVAMNAHLPVVIADDETGFNGTSDEAYRTEAWDFILAGGAIFDNLDYSFTVGHEDGTFEYPDTQPGGGSTSFRRQMQILSDFVGGFGFIHMKPDASVVVGGVPEGGSVQALVEEGRAYAVYVQGRGPTTLLVEMPEGTYRAEWVNPVTGEVDKRAGIEHAGGPCALESPAFDADCALRLMRVGGER